MSDKEECPACHTYSWDIAQAVKYGNDCPRCGLSHATLTEILEIQESRADAELRATCEAALVRAGKAEVELALLRRQLEQIQELANRKPEDFMEAE